MKIIKVIGYFLIITAIVLIFTSLHYSLFENEKNIKFFFPICSLGFFCLAYNTYKENKIAEENGEITFLTFKRSIYMSIILGILLIFLFIVI